MADSIRSSNFCISLQFFQLNFSNLVCDGLYKPNRRAGTRNFAPTRGRIGSKELFHLMFKSNIPARFQGLQIAQLRKRPSRNTLNDEIGHWHHRITHDTRFLEKHENNTSCLSWFRKWSAKGTNDQAPWGSGQGTSKAISQAWQQDRWIPGAVVPQLRQSEQGEWVNQERRKRTTVKTGRRAPWLAQMYSLGFHADKGQKGKSIHSCLSCDPHKNN